MPLGKRKFTGRSGPRRKRRRTMIRRPWRSMTSSRGGFKSVFNFQRRLFIETIGVTNLADFMKGYSFNLNQLSNVTEYTSLFDQYRICGIQIAIVPTITGFDSASPSTSLSTFLIPEVRTIVDHDDSANPASFNEMYEYKYCKMTRGNRVHTRYFKPSILQQAYESAVATAYTPKYNQWLSTTDPATPHYGLKIGIDALGSANTGTMNFRLYAKFYIQCKNPK